MKKILKIDINTSEEVCGPGCYFLDDVSFDNPLGISEPRRCRLFDVWLGEADQLGEILRCKQCLGAEEAT